MDVASGYSVPFFHWDDPTRARGPGLMCTHVHLMRPGCAPFPRTLPLIQAFITKCLAQPFQPSLTAAAVRLPKSGAARAAEASLGAR